MAATNHERVGRALDLLRVGLGPFVEREIRNAARAKRIAPAVLRQFDGDPDDVSGWDAAAMLRLMAENWNFAFQRTLGPAERGFVGELRGHRNNWAHQKPFSGDDAYRALDTAHRLLSAVSAPQAAEVEKLKMELLRVRFDEQARGQRRRRSGLSLGGAEALKPWREVISPHPDVAGGRYQQAEFAADLWQAHLGEGAEEYRDPVEFFRRTYLTTSLSRMLAGAVERLSGTGGDPVVQLQTNFGGGKTHSMLALYHLCSGVPARSLPGVDAVLGSAHVPGRVKRVVLVGNRISPGNPMKKPDGTEVRTLWGELAWQLGGREAYRSIARDDESATSPGDRLRQLLEQHGPCLILIDEWVAYARQLHESGVLPAGSFDTQFSFAQALTETVKAAGNCMVVVSLPASDTAGSSDAASDALEVGGQRGREALHRLRNVVGRLESSWRPAGVEEGFEIVRRRLFEPFSDQTQFRDRDAVARRFGDYYRAESGEFPQECRSSDYERRIRDAYPIHPEVFDRLYTDWSTLVTFQRTRGVLRLMAAVIHSLWQSDDRSPLILPASLPIDDQQVQFELTRYLPGNWVPVIESDVDGSGALPRQIDGDVPNLGKFSACRRVARTVYLGSAPSAGAAHRGIEDRRVHLGAALPGERLAVIGDALRRLSATATYLYQDGSRYWYDTRPTVTKLAADYAELLRRDPDRIATAIGERLREALKETDRFPRIHAIPRSPHDVPDERTARLVVLGIEAPHHRDGESPALAAAAEILASRGKAPRIFRNTLVFLAADQTRLQELDEAVRRQLAWEKVLADRGTLDLSPHQVRQAETQEKAAGEAVRSRLPETYQWLLTPVQDKPDDPPGWHRARLTGVEGLAARAARRLVSDDRLASSLAPTALRRELDNVPLWADGGNHVEIRQLVEHFAQYLYLPRLRDPKVLVEAVNAGVGLLGWSESFALADSFDEKNGRYQGLRGGQVVGLYDPDSAALVVHPEAARQQLDEPAPTDPDKATPDDHTKPDGSEGNATTGAPVSTNPKRYHGTVALDPARAATRAGEVATEVIAHLAGLPDAEVTVTLEIEATIPGGAPDRVVRIVTENGRTLKFGETSGFEEE